MFSAKKVKNCASEAANPENTVHPQSKDYLYRKNRVLQCMMIECKNVDRI